MNNKVYTICRQPISHPLCELKTRLASLQNRVHLYVSLLLPEGFSEVSIHLSTSIYSSVHLSVCPCVCASVTLYIPCVQSAHLTRSDSGSTRCQMPNYNWEARLCLNTVHYIVSVRHEHFSTPPLYLCLGDKIQHGAFNAATYYMWLQEH